MVYAHQWLRQFHCTIFISHQRKRNIKTHIPKTGLGPLVVAVESTLMSAGYGTAYMHAVPSQKVPASNPSFRRVNCERATGFSLCQLLSRLRDCGNQLGEDHWKATGTTSVRMPGLYRCTEPSRNAYIRGRVLLSGCL